MSANIAVAKSGALSQVKANHARQVVDQVTLLRERVRRQESAIEAVIVERDKALECCEKQKKVIADLRAKLEGRPETGSALRVVAEDDDTVDIAELDLLSEKCSDSRGSNFGHTGEGPAPKRINSMRAALMRIGGVEVPDNSDQMSALPNDEFDASEFQPIAEEQESSVRQVFAGVYSRLTSMSGSRSSLEEIESDGLQTSR